jgi:Uma2 family endonuclease
MGPSTGQPERWTVADLELMPADGTVYELINGKLFTSQPPTWEHQHACSLIFMELQRWSYTHPHGEARMAPDLLFSKFDNVLPDVIWISAKRMALLWDGAGHLCGAPELVVEVLSPGPENEQRDREAKRRLYAAQGIQEYWIADWHTQQVTIYRLDDARLRQAALLHATDTITSPLLPGFACPVRHLFQRG